LIPVARHAVVMNPRCLAERGRFYETNPIRTANFALSFAKRSHTKAKRRRILPNEMAGREPSI